MEKITFKTTRFPSLFESLLDFELEKLLKESNTSTLVLEAKDPNNPFTKHFYELLDSEFGVKSLKELNKEQKGQFFTKLKETWKTKKANQTKVNEELTFQDLDSISGNLQDYPDLKGLGEEEELSYDIISSKLANTKTMIELERNRLADSPVEAIDPGAFEKLAKMIEDMKYLEDLAKQFTGSQFGASHSANRAGEIEYKAKTDYRSIGNAGSALKESRQILILEKEVKDEDSFREYATAVLKKAHGDNFDKDKAEEVITGLMKKYKDDWGAMVGAIKNS